MTTETLRAWVLHKWPTGDTSVRVILYSLEKGIVSCLCQGGRTPKKQALLQAFTPLWFSLRVKNDWYLIQKHEPLASPVSLKGSSLFAGIYLNELLYLNLHPCDPSPLLFNSYCHTLENLSLATNNQMVEILLRQFERTLLNICGQGFDFLDNHCNEPIKEDNYYQFIPKEGFKRTKTGYLGSDLLQFANENFQEDKIRKIAKQIMRQAIDALLEGKPLKSRELYQINRPK